MRSPRSAAAARCTSSRAAGIRGSRSISRRTTGAPAPRSCRPSTRSAARYRPPRPNNWGERFVMYERFYNLRERPFALSPDPDYLYPSRVHREALDYLRFAIEGHAGFVVITGEIGSGKTTLLQVLLRTLDGQTTVVRLVNTLLTGVELLESML